MYNILDYGAINEVDSMSTQAFQTVVEECRKNGGGVVYIPFGTYVISSVVLCSNIHFLFEPGAVILGTLDPDEYNAREVITYPLYQDASHSYFQRSMFIAENCDNISFSGEGIIDMRSVWENNLVEGEGPQRGKRAAKIFAFKCCSNVTLKDMTLLHATDLAVYLAGCKNVRITGLSMDVYIDGISPDCCENVVISNCIICSGDDGIVLKSSYTLNEKRVCENVVITNCIVSSRCCAIKLGTESNGGFRNVTISNCSIHDTLHSGLALEITDGGEMDGVTVSNIVMKNVGHPFFIILSDRRRGPDGTDIGTMKNILLDNITVSGPYEPWLAPDLTGLFNDEKLIEPKIMTSTITGQPGKKIENIILSNIYITVPGGGTEEDKNIILPEVTKVSPANFHFGEKFPVYGIFFRHVKNLTLNNVKMNTLNEDMRNMFSFEDVDNWN